MKKEKVVGFVRVSTLKQTISMKNQVSRIKQYSKENNLDFIGIEIDKDYFNFASKRINNEVE